MHIKPLDTYPDMLALDEYYFNMFNVCGHDFQKVAKYCELYGMSNDEILESLSIMRHVAVLVKE